MTATLATDLREWVEDETDATVREASPIGSGSSRRIWLLDLSDGASVVVREDTLTGPVAGTPLDLAREGAVYRALSGSGLPVPRLLGVSPDGRALLLERADGTESVKALGPEQRATVIGDYGGWLGRLHTLDTDDLDLGPLRISGGGSPTQHDIELWQSIHDTRSGDYRTPSTTAALSWLRDNEPAGATRVSLCHGDAGPGNFLHRDGSVTAMLDWEFAHLGDPHDDLAWVAVRNEALGRPVLPALAYAAWRTVTGDDIDVTRLEYYRALVLTRMAISCDATLQWTGGAETRDNRAQVLLRPYLGLAIVEALRRAGCPAVLTDAVEPDARRTWETSTIATLLGDPAKLDDLGAAL